MDAIATIEVPVQLLVEIDEVVGAEQRSAFIHDAMRSELRRRRMLDYVRSGEPAWKDADHPELAEGSYAWVRKLRDEGERRMEALEARRNAE